MKEQLEKIKEYALEEIMGQRFGRYSKYIIQDRAIPDARDGLKPVQRRILYSMYKEKNTYDKPYKKSAKTVGDVIGTLHPHGDSSIYDAMVRMSQSWKVKNPYIDMHGNNGSIDGDSPAAYRYTEARLSKISNELLKDLDKDTVIFAPNFDDSLMEPTVLPARFPNLIVNGTNGISAGYATNIPPHNLGEVIDATIELISNPSASLDELMKHVLGPDFPTGGIVEGKDGIRQAYTTGRGKIVVKSKTKIEEGKKEKAIIVTEIPYEVNKAQLVRKIDEIRIDKKIDGIIEVRDESDKDGLRIAIDLKKEANSELVLNYLLKNTELQVNYNFNMIAIVNRRPKLMGLIDILNAYINHQKEVITKRCEFDLANKKFRLHIVSGFIRCLSILDEVVHLIRHSKNKADAKENLVKEFEFTMDQAEAIVTLQLYRLTNTDVQLLEEELAKLEKEVGALEKILSDEKLLKEVMKRELKQIKEEYNIPRLTEIKDFITEIKIDTTEMIPKEDVVVMVTKDGYVKRTSKRSYSSSVDDAQLKDGDYVLGLFELNTLDTLLLFTNLGNYLYVSVHLLPDLKWKDLGKHISNIIKLEQDEELIGAIPVESFDKDVNIILVSKNGLIKKTTLKEFKASRYTKPIICMKLKDDDKLIYASVIQGSEIFLSSYHGYGLWFDERDVPVVGLRASGVKAMNLKEDYLISASSFTLENHDFVTIISDKKTAKRVRLSDFEKTSRARRGLILFKEIKSNPYHVLKAFVTNIHDAIGTKQDDIIIYKNSEFPILDRYSTGSTIAKQEILDAFIVQELVEKGKNNQENSNIEEKDTPIVKDEEAFLKDIDDRLMTIDDFLN